MLLKIQTAMGSPAAQPDDLLESLAKSQEYPGNIIDKQTYSATLKAYQQRLDDVAPILCCDAEADAVVPIRDFNANTQSGISNILLGELY